MSYPPPIEPGFIFWGLPVVLLGVLAVYVGWIRVVERRERADEEG